MISSQLNVAGIAPKGAIKIRCLTHSKCPEYVSVKLSPAAFKRDLISAQISPKSRGDCCNIDRLVNQKLSCSSYAPFSPIWSGLLLMIHNTAFSAHTPFSLFWWIVQWPQTWRYYWSSSKLLQFGLQTTLVPERVTDWYRRQNYMICKRKRLSFWDSKHGQSRHPGWVCVTSCPWKQDGRHWATNTNWECIWAEI